MSHGLEASQGGTKHQDQHEEQEEGPKGPLTRLDPTTFGRLLLQEALKWGPRAFQEDPCGAQLAANAIVFQCFVVWQQGKVAPSSKTNEKSNRAIFGPGASLGSPPSL